MKLYLLDANEQIIDTPPTKDVLSLIQDLKLKDTDTIEGALVVSKRYTSIMDNVRYIAVSDRDNDHTFYLYRKTMAEVQDRELIFDGKESFWDDLAGSYIKDKRPGAMLAPDLVKLILDGTRWTVDFVDSGFAETLDTNFYYQSRAEALSSVTSAMAIDVVPMINIEGNTITRRYVNLYVQAGGDNGRRFVYGKNALSVVKKTDDSQVFTALVGRGKSIEQTTTDTETGDASTYNTPKINFADVEWSKAAGDPVDKPKGQEYVEWPESTKLYGYSNGNPRIGIVDFDNDDDPAQLLKDTWAQLQTMGVPSVQFSATVGDVGYLAKGETVTIVNYVKGIAYKTRVTELKWNRLAEAKSQLTIGDKLVQNASERMASIATQQSNASIQAAAQTIAKQAANLVTVTNAFGVNVSWSKDGTMPPEPKEGDIVYIRNDDGTITMKSYKDGQWIIIIDDTTGTQVQKKVDNALSQAAAAQKQANDAVAKANSSAQLASMSNQTAQAAKSAADSANALATQAVSATSDAKTALATANSALETATDQKTTVATLVTKTDDLAGTMATLATKTDINKLSGEVTTAKTLAQQTADGLQLKADQSVVNTINGSVNQLSADLKVANDRLSFTMTKNDVTGLLTPYATQSWTQGQITATASQFNVQFSSISGKVDALKFGNRNLIRNTSNITNLDHWHQAFWGSPTTSVRLTTHDFYKHGASNMIVLHSGDGIDAHMQTDAVAVKPDTDYTVQFVGFHNFNVKSVTVYFLGRSKDTDAGSHGDNYDDNKIHLLLESIWISNSEARRITAKFHTLKDEEFGFLRFDMNGGKKADETADLYVVEAELAEGDQVPVYSPAPEDSMDYADKRVASLKVTVDGIQATVANNQGQTTAALQTLQGFQTTATNQLSGLQSQQTQLSNQWTSVIGGLSNPNLILNSMYPVDKNLLGWLDVTDMYINAHVFYAKGGQTHFAIANSTTDERTVATNRFKLTRGATYTMSVKAYASWNVKGMDVYVLKRKRNSTRPDGYDNDGVQQLLNNVKPSPSQMDKYTVTFDAGDFDEAYLRVDNNGSIDGNNAMLGFAEPKVELGSMATPDVQSGTDSQITQLQDAINLRVSKGDVLSQINLEANRTLIQSGKLVLDAPTVVFTGNAFIPSAAISSLSADKITTGTLNAANLNVINLNASAIVTGTIYGPNLAINLNTGMVEFQKGRIHSTDNNIDINIDKSYMSVADSTSRVLLKGGQIQFVQPTLFDLQTTPYLSISNDGVGSNWAGATIVGRDSIMLANSANVGSDTMTWELGKNTFSGLISGKKSDGRWTPTIVGGAERGVVIVGGAVDTSLVASSPYIRVGSSLGGSAAGNCVYVRAEYIMAPPVYGKTSSGSANVIVKADGALVRTSSATKYKSNIERFRSTDMGETLLSLPQAHWYNKEDMQRYVDDPQHYQMPELDYGMIAEDLAAAGLEDLVVRGDDGELEDIRYDRVAPALLPLLAKMKQEIEELKGEKSE